jgi:transcriptional regulator with GAF, ATPase, and Fis domain
VEPFYRDLKKTLSDGWWRNDLLERLQEQPISR